MFQRKNENDIKKEVNEFLKVKRRTEFKGHSLLCIRVMNSVFFEKERRKQNDLYTKIIHKNL